jgi:hypothetical protein
MKRNITMAKKKKKKTPKNRTTHPKQTARASKKRSKYPLLAMIAGGVLVLTGVYFLYQEKKPQTPPPELTQLKKENINLQENRPTLSPARFSGRVKRAYEIAREIPEVLDQLYCYCRCKENFGHKNLLSCYVDTHAST